VKNTLATAAAFINGPFEIPTMAIRKIKERQRSE
jgi:hypothetical protein